ncbi:MAG TPA: diguanylate cyclase [Roseiarcus sp.]|jgi:diguanylate cyclase (GGDEF)-like protein
MAERSVSFDGVAACAAARGFEPPESAFDAALLREQYRALARLGPYVHGIIILAALAFFCATRPTGLLLVVLPAALIAVSAFRLVCWFRARAGVEFEALDRIRRKVRVASLLGPALTLAVALTMAISTWRDDVAEFAATLLAVWVIAAVCAICLNRIASEANVIVIAATGPLVVAFLARGAELTLGLAALVAVAACFIIRMLDEHFRMFAEIVRSRFIIAERQRVAEEARLAAITIALTDDLTGLPNRRCFHGLLADKIRTATQTGEPFALGLIDLDGFKPINDAHGHPVGDEILRQVGDRLARAMDGRGSAARIGGDEFAIICDVIGGRDEAVALGEEIQSVFATPFAIQPLNLRLTSACGLALFPSSSVEPNDLVRVTDAALYRAKAIGRGGAVVFDARAASAAGARFEDALERPIFESEIERAVSRTRFARRLRSAKNGQAPALEPSIGQPVLTGTLSLGAFAERRVDQVSR